ncbi:MAG: 50S ribosomal protein L25/general stress protein Ctc [Alphaproteobacteria bacterium]|nr:50S ribosomal protein L25/general stress protein Ctc [Alphaproteobacteria bacterium]
MSDMLTIPAKKRDRAGKGGARASRREGFIPAVIYGDKQPPMPISVEPKQLERVMHAEGFFNHRILVEVDGTKYDVLPRDVQLDPVTDRPIHFDFLRVGVNSVITVQVPVHFRNEGASPGIKRGGVLNIILHEIAVRTRADQIPQFFEVDLTGLEIGGTVHLSALKLPDGVRVLSREKDATIASIAPPTVGREAEPTAAAATATAAAPAAGAAAAGAAATTAAPAAGAKATPGKGAPAAAKK